LLSPHRSVDAVVHWQQLLVSAQHHQQTDNILLQTNISIYFVYEPRSTTGGSRNEWD